MSMRWAGNRRAVWGIVASIGWVAGCRGFLSESGEPPLAPRFACPTGPAFVKSTPITLGNAPYFVSAGDFNGDGHLDVAVPDYGEGKLNVLFGDGMGGLAQAPGSPYTVGDAPCCEVVGDFNRDGFDDVAVTTSGGRWIYVFLGRDAGPLTPANDSPFSTGGQSDQVTMPAVADFNRDGNLDVVIPTAGSVRVLLGAGDGRLVSGPSVSVPGTPISVAIGDFNGDDLLDVDAANYTSNAMNVLFGRGNGELTAAGGPWPTGSSTTGLAVGDFDGDANLDVAITDYGAGAITIFLGDGHGAFRAAGRPIPVGSTPTDVVTADFDGDGHLDLVVTVNGSGTLRVLRGHGDGTFSDARSSPMSVGPYPGSLISGDFNEDGRLDVALTNNIPGTWTVSLLLNACVP